MTSNKPSFAAVLVFWFALVQAAPAATWTGLAAPDNNWTTAGNWDAAVPGSGDSAIFSGPGNSNTTISLGGGTQPIHTILFDTASAAAYTLGEMLGDTLHFADGGLLIVDGSVTMPQVIHADVLTSGSGILVTNNVSNGGPLVGDGLIGLALNDVSIAGDFIITNGTATTTTAINGDITDRPGDSGRLTLLSPTGGGGAANINSNFILMGNNTYSGGTMIQANTGSNGAVQVGTDSAFGTGKIRTVFQGNSVEFKALGGTRTISNAIDLDGGINFAGVNSFVLDGPIAIASGNSRTLSNKIAPGATLTLGASPGSSVIHLGNPTSNGGDGVGRTIIVSATPDSTIIVNALFQDVDATSSESAVRYGGNAGGNIIINTPQSYTSPTILGGGSSTVQFKHDYNTGDPAGPFGLGTLVAANAANNQLAPIEGDRTIANPIQMDVGFTVDNIPGDSSSVTFSGPITFTSTASRLIQNKMHPTTGGTLTLGSATSPSTFTLGETPGLTVTFTGTGRTIVNDTIEDALDSMNQRIPNNIAVQNSSTTTFNGAQNTDGNFTVTGIGSTAIINGTRTGSGALGITGTDATLLVNGSKVGSGAVTINGSGTLGGTGSIDGDVTNNGMIAPGVGIGTLTLNDNVALAADSRLAIELSGSSVDTLAVGGNLDLSNVDFLDVTGTGAGSWIIVTYGGALTGTFDNVTPGYTVDYGTGMNSQITLSAIGVGVAGDFNNDGAVDAADYVVWRKHLGGNDPLPNDNDLGTPIGASHYDLWRANFGNGAGGGALSGAVVPEPATAFVLVSMIAGLAGLPARRRVFSAARLGRRLNDCNVTGRE